jgi:hypothetical protein
MECFRDLSGNELFKFFRISASAATVISHRRQDATLEPCNIALSGAWANSSPIHSPRLTPFAAVSSFCPQRHTLCPE